MNSFYLEEELKYLGFKRIGSNVMISKKASFYGASEMEIGDNVRIDDFCILSGKIKLGSHIHISAYVALYGAMGIELEDYTGISPRTTVFSAMDDFSGEYLIGPIHHAGLTKVCGGPVVLRSFAQIGAHSVIFPNVVINEGAIVGAMSLVKQDVESWTIVAGIPARFMSNRKRELLNLL